MAAFIGNVWCEGSSVHLQKSPKVSVNTGERLEKMDCGVGQGVVGSNPAIPTNKNGSIPVTWVTVYSEHIGNTFGPNGLSIGSTRMVSSSK